MHEVGALGAVVAVVAAQVADEGAVAEAMDALAHQRAAPAVVAGGALSGLLADAFAQQFALEVGLGDAQQGPQHGAHVRRRPPGSCRRPLVAHPLTLVFSFDISGSDEVGAIRSSGGQRPDKQAKFRYRAD
jgi:hypothetical protein